MRRQLAALAILAVLGTALVSVASAQEHVLVIRGGRVHTLVGGDAPIDNGVVVIRGGTITAVGGADTPVPDGAEIIDATGMEVVPGFMDAVTRLGLTEIGAVDVTSDFRELGNNNPHLQAATAVHPASEIIPVTRANGVTHAVAAPQGQGIAGQGSLLHLDGWTVEEMLIDPGVYMVVQWPGLGGRGFRGGGGGFGRGGRGQSFADMKEAYDQTIADLEKLLADARRYDAAGVGDDPLRRNLKLEALARVARGELPLMISVNDTRGITDAVEFGERNGVRVIIAGGNDSWKVAEMLADKHVPVILGPTQAMPTGPDDGYDTAYARPVRLYEAGVTFALATQNASDSRTLPYEIATAIPYGLPHDEALKAITLYPAQILGVDDRLGTLEAGKIANLVVTEGDPLEIETRVAHIVINGVALDPADNRHDRSYEKYRGRPRRGGQ